MDFCYDYVSYSTSFYQSCPEVWVPECPCMSAAGWWRCRLRGTPRCPAAVGCVPARRRAPCRWTAPELYGSHSGWTHGSTDCKTKGTHRAGFVKTLSWMLFISRLLWLRVISNELMWQICLILQRKSLWNRFDWKRYNKIHIVMTVLRGKEFRKMTIPVPEFFLCVLIYLLILHNFT